MHELSLCQNLLRQIEQIAQQQQASQIKSIQLSIGALAGIEPELLQQAFDIGKKTTLAASATLHIERPPLLIHCPHCDVDQEVSLQDMRCPCCHAAGTLLGGDEIMLTGMDYC